MTKQEKNELSTLISEVSTLRTEIDALNRAIKAAALGFVSALGIGADGETGQGLPKGWDNMTGKLTLDAEPPTRVVRVVPTGPDGETDQGVGVDVVTTPVFGDEEGLVRLGKVLSNAEGHPAEQEQQPEPDLEPEPLSPKEQRVLAKAAFADLLALVGRDSALALLAKFTAESGEPAARFSDVVDADLGDFIARVDAEAHDWQES